MGTNLGLKLVEKGILVSGTDILEQNVVRAKEYGALNNEFDSQDDRNFNIIGDVFYVCESFSVVN